MAAHKPTAVPQSPFSTTPVERFLVGYSQVLNACLGSEIEKINQIVERAEADNDFERKHGMSRKDWDSALSLHLHGDLQ